MYALNENTEKDDNDDTCTFLQKITSVNEVRMIGPFDDRTLSNLTEWVTQNVN